MTTYNNVTIGQSFVRNFLTGGVENPGHAHWLRDVSDVSYSTLLFGGYDTATIKIDIPAVVMMGAFDMLGGEIKIYDILGNQVWEGFVNKVITSDQTAEVSYGPLMEIANAVNLKYNVYESHLDQGEQAETGFVTGTGMTADISRHEWGVLSDIISAPRALTSAEADAVVINLCDALALPKQNVVMPKNSETPSLELECLGYFHLMKKMVADYYDPDDHDAPYVMSYPFSVGAAGFFNTGNVEQHADDPTMHLWNEEAEMAFDFLESAYSILNTYGDYGYSFGVYNDRSLVLRRIERPMTPDIHISIKSMSPQYGRGGGPAVIPGMWAKPVNVPFYIPPVAEDMFFISSLEFSGGVLSINRETFSAVDRVLGNRGL